MHRQTHSMWNSWENVHKKQAVKAKVIFMEISHVFFHVNLMLKWIHEKFTLKIYLWNSCERIFRWISHMKTFACVNKYWQIKSNSNKAKAKACEGRLAGAGLCFLLIPHPHSFIIFHHFCQTFSFFTVIQKYYQNILMKFSIFTISPIWPHPYSTIPVPGLMKFTILVDPTLVILTI